ncbi:MAG: cysteine--tRNA ligase [Spirochaetales bacterium]|nr:cysteine--tRNA ligase [Spirochaetales bacterium]
MELKLFNTLGREIKEIVPIEDNRIKMYACGPTVYKDAHIGNLRTYIAVDILKRVLTLAGYDVTYAMNITDVGHLSDDADEGEDKMLKGAREQGMSVWDIAEFYTKAFFRDTDALNIQKPDIICKATEHIDDMINLIKRIEENGYTYFAGGNLYFDISKFPGYGKLALLDLSELKAGSRIMIDENKKNPYDFVLWFTQSKFEHQTMLWDSPWGKGYPGWHIECSAMSMKYLGDQFDIHCGGIDLIPVHHTNEIAQSEAATGKKWVEHWMHGEFLITSKGKMSKSTGDFYTLNGLKEQGYHPLDYRYFCLLGHYRSQLQFSLEGLDSAQNARKNLGLRIAQLMKQAKDTGDSGNPEEVEYYTSFISHALDDLNMPQCLSDLWNLMKSTNISPGLKLKTIRLMDKILGLDLDKVTIDTAIDDEIKDLIDKREQARKNKDYALSDKIRDELKQKGIVIEDTPEGVQWRKI